MFGIKKLRADLEALRAREFRHHSETWERVSALRTRVGEDALGLLRWKQMVGENFDKLRAKVNPEIVIGLDLANPGTSDYTGVALIKREDGKLAVCATFERIDGAITANFREGEYEADPVWDAIKAYMAGVQ